MLARPNIFRLFRTPIFCTSGNSGVECSTCRLFLSRYAA